MEEWQALHGVEEPGEEWEHDRDDEHGSESESGEMDSDSDCEAMVRSIQRKVRRVRDLHRPELRKALAALLELP